MIGERGIPHIVLRTGRRRRPKLGGPPVAAPLIAAVVKSTGIVKIESIEPMITNKRAFHAALDQLRIMPLGQAVA